MKHIYLLLNVLNQHLVDMADRQICTIYENFEAI